MKTAILAIVVTVISLLALSMYSDTSCAQSGCGFKPFPPMGCKSSDAVCRCDDGGCSWVWYCK